ncbi:MAG: SET domain-containing protein-lysine N-methyltransferase [SAR324 cluster bacterium]|nr:SET domain-containing protein-lysine N-methyltransferase [SAR324 cluster bacterium]
MFRVKYRVGQSSIPCAGNGLFVEEQVTPGKIIVAPDGIDRIIDDIELKKLPTDSIEYQSSVCWFENIYSLTPDWPDECYINHSFDPNGMWHLGFVFCMKPIQPGDELTIDYRYLIKPGDDIGFDDSVTGRKIIGYHWEENIWNSTQKLLQVLQPPQS